MKNLILVITLVFIGALSFGCSMEEETIHRSSENAPIVNPGKNQVVAVGDMVHLDASKSYDLDLDTLTYKWRIMDEPNKGQTTIINSDSVSATFKANEIGNYSIELEVNDNTGHTVSTSIQVTSVSAMNVSSTVELRTALQIAENDNIDNMIILHSGIYQTQSDGGGTFTFADNQEKSLYLVTNSNDKVILDGSHIDQVFIDSSTNGKITVDGLTFINGQANEGAGMHLNREASVINCKFLDNNASDHGGGLFLNNTADVINSIFLRNEAEYGGALSFSGDWLGGPILRVSNSLFIGNSSGISIGSGRRHIIINSIFENIGDDIYAGQSVTLSNNYIDNSKVDGQIIYYNYGNIFKNINLGFVDKDKNDFHLTQDSDLIAAGWNEEIAKSHGDDETYLFYGLLPDTDIDENSRAFNKIIDIGPYEYQQ